MWVEILSLLQDFATNPVNTAFASLAGVMIDLWLVMRHVGVLHIYTRILT